MTDSEFNALETVEQGSLDVCYGMQILEATRLMINKGWIVLTEEQLSGTQCARITSKGYMELNNERKRRDA